MKYFVLGLIVATTAIASADADQMCGDLSGGCSPHGLCRFFVDRTHIYPDMNVRNQMLELLNHGTNPRVCILGHWTSSGPTVFRASLVWNATIVFSPAASNMIFEGMKRAGVPVTEGGGLLFTNSLAATCSRFNYGLSTCDYIDMDGQQTYHSEGPAEVQVYDEIRNSGLPVMPMNGDRGWFINTGKLHCQFIPAQSYTSCWELQ